MSRLSTLSRSIDDKVAIVTGAASGMGRATAHLFADEGARVVVADLGADRVAAVANEISAAHGGDRVLGIECDVADHEQLRSMVEATVQRFGRLDIVVNNAGVSMINSAFQPEDEFEANWATTLDINLTAHARLIRLALPHLITSGEGRIVNIASTESIVTTAGLAAYAATKAGVVGLTKSLAVELGRHGVTVNCVCPGPIDTGMTAGIDAEAKEKYARRRVPLRRYGTPEEVAHMTLNLCMPASSFVNGTSIPVDGGMTIRHT
ncbi:SDR family NAD(P)-dependent oxidoreductase [Ilumatobacter sp.]|uniref:SDR family NAD(P)-dependent oxidoreductase n=1 Tax=Ilumatobacter sp. TaxID=1967498 RepID=UPI0037509B31